MGTAADIDLILEHYGLFSTDEAIKNNLGQFDKKFIAIGTEKRNAVFSNLAKRKLASAKKSDLWSLATLATTATLQEVVDSILIELGGTVTKTEEELAQDEILAVEEEAAVSVDSVSEVTAEAEVQPTQEEDPQEVLQDNVEQPGASKSKEEILSRQTKEVGTCSYGVPIIPIVRIVPDVFGLKESLLSDFTKEEMQDFYNLMKSKVTPNAKK